MDNMTRIDCLAKDGTLPKGELIELLSSYSEADRIYAAERARKISLSVFGRKIYTRGLIEISNYCRNDCYYCGIEEQHESRQIRLSLTRSITAATGDTCGFRTFVLQGGEDSFFTTTFLWR